jgi:hypothetical protein
MKLTALVPDDERLLQAVSAHESGHFTACTHFGLNPRAYISGPGTAAVKHRLGCGWQTAVICWAAPVAEDLLKCRHPSRTLPDYELSAATFGRWFCGMTLGGGLKQFAKYAITDAALLDGQNCYQAETARLAFDILEARLPWLEWKAERLANEFREQFRAAQLRGDQQADMRELLATIHSYEPNT